MPKPKKITNKMGLAEAIAISQTFPLETLLKNFQSKSSVTVWRSAEEVLAECPDPQTMPRLLELLNQDLNAQGNSTWFRPIELRLRNKSLPEREKKLAISALLPLVDLKVNKEELEPVAAKALSALSGAQPLPSELVERFIQKLDHPHYHVASSALGILINLPPAERGPWVPLLLKHFHGRFSKDGNSEGVWIIECLLPHFTSHRKQIVSVLQAGLKSDHAFIPRSVLEVLHQLGPVAAELVPDVLEHIGRQKAYTNEEPHLIHIDPEGTVAIPGLIRLLGNNKATVRYQAAVELEAYGARAEAAIPELTKLANAKSQDKRLVAAAAQRALLAVEVQRAGGSVPEKLSQTERLFGLLGDVIMESPEEP
jgi:hypothetical protein